MAEKIYLQKGEEEGPTKNHRRLLDRQKNGLFYFFKKYRRHFAKVTSENFGRNFVKRSSEETPLDIRRKKGRVISM